MFNLILSTIMLKYLQKKSIDMVEAQGKHFRFPYYVVLQKSERQILLLKMLKSFFEKKQSRYNYTNDFQHLTSDKC